MKGAADRSCAPRTSDVFVLRCWPADCVVTGVTFELEKKRKKLLFIEETGHGGNSITVQCVEGLRFICSALANAERRRRSRFGLVL